MRLDVLWCPIVVFRAVITQDVAPWRTVAPLVISAVVSIAQAFVMAARHRAALASVYDALGSAAPPVVVELSGAAFAAVGTILVAFWLPTLLALMLGVLASTAWSGRFVECAALAWWSQVVGGVAVLVAVWGWYEPPVFLRRPSVAPLGAYQEAIADVPLLETLQLVTLYFRIWFVALLACALRAVCEVSVGTAWASGVLMVLVLHVVGPWAVQWL